MPVLVALCAVACKRSSVLSAAFSDRAKGAAEVMADPPVVLPVVFAAEDPSPKLARLSEDDLQRAAQAG